MNDACGIRGKSDSAGKEARENRATQKDNVSEHFASSSINQLTSAEKDSRGYASTALMVKELLP